MASKFVVGLIIYRLANMIISICRYNFLLNILYPLANMTHISIIFFIIVGVLSNLE